MASHRSLEVDFFRGVVLIVIVLDHISGSMLSHLTLHAYAYCDAAEVFVFLGGYATAAAYTALAQRAGPAKAAQRFVIRAWEIYRAYLLTVGLILGFGLVVRAVNIATPTLDYTGVPALLAHPLTTLLNLLSLRTQPYLSSVLPMYMCFALAAPLTVPLARRAPLAALLASLLIWLAAIPLATLLPAADAQGWGFNPFAWQLMFMFGMLCRLQPLSPEFLASITARRLTYIAWVIVVCCAAIKLLLETTPEAGHYKQNLAGFRVLSFVALAWLAAQAVRSGWINRIARTLPQLVTVGQHGLACFVSGALISMLADTLLRTIAPTHDGVLISRSTLAFLEGLSVDCGVIVLMLSAAALFAGRKRARSAQPRPLASLTRAAYVPVKRG